MLTTDGCCGSITVGWKRPPQDPFMRTAARSAPPPLLPPPPSTPPAPPPSECTPSRTDAHPWSALVTPAAHLPNFRYSPAGKARFTAQEWAVVQSFLRWLVGSGGNGSGGEGGGNGGGGEGDCGCGEGDGGEGEGTVHRAEWCYAASAAEGLSDREAGIINYLRGLNITPCLTYLLARSLEPEPDPTPSLEPTQPAPDTTSPLPSKRSELATLTIDVGAFAIEVVATRGAVSGISLVHESDSNPHPNPHPDPKSNPSPNSDQVHESGRRETVSPSSGEGELRCPQVQAPAAVPAPGPAAPAAPAAESGGAAAGAAGGVAGGAVGTVPALGLTFRPVSGHALVVRVYV